MIHSPKRAIFSSFHTVTAKSKRTRDHRPPPPFVKRNFTPPPLPRYNTQMPFSLRSRLLGALSCLLVVGGVWGGGASAQLTFREIEVNTRQITQQINGLKADMQRSRHYDYRVNYLNVISERSTAQCQQLWAVQRQIIERLTDQSANRDPRVNVARERLNTLMGNQAITDFTRPLTAQQILQLQETISNGVYRVDQFIDLYDRDQLRDISEQANSATTISVDNVRITPDGFSTFGVCPQTTTTDMVNDPTCRGLLTSPLSDSQTEKLANNDYHVIRTCTASASLTTTGRQILDLLFPPDQKTLISVRPEDRTPTDRTDQQYSPENTVLPLGDTGWDTILTDNIIIRRIVGSQTQDLLTRQGIFIPSLIDSINVIVGAFGILFLLITAIQMTLNQGDPEKQKQYRLNLVWIFVGLGVVSVAEFAAFDILNPEKNPFRSSTSIVYLRLLALRVLGFIRYIAIAAILIMGLITGYQLITTPDEENALKQEFLFLQSVAYGAVFIVGAEVFVAILSMTGLDPSDNPTAIANAGDRLVAGAATQIAGFIRLILSLAITIGVVVLIWAALYYLTSLGRDESMNKAKSLIISTVIGLIVAVSSYTLVTYFVV